MEGTFHLPIVLLYGKIHFKEKKKMGKLEIYFKLSYEYM